MGKPEPKKTKWKIRHHSGYGEVYHLHEIEGDRVYPFTEVGIYGRKLVFRGVGGGPYYLWEDKNEIVNMDEFQYLIKSHSSDEKPKQKKRAGWKEKARDFLNKLVSWAEVKPPGLKFIPNAHGGTFVTPSGSHPPRNLCEPPERPTIYIASLYPAMIGKLEGVKKYRWIRNMKFVLAHEFSHYYNYLELGENYSFAEGLESMADEYAFDVVGISREEHDDFSDEFARAFKQRYSLDWDTGKWVPETPIKKVISEVYG